MEYFLIYMKNYLLELKESLLTIKKKIRKPLSIKVDIGTGVSEILYDYNNNLDKIEIIGVKGPLKEESIEELEEIVKSVLFGLMNRFVTEEKIIDAINSNDTIDLREEPILNDIQNIEKKKRVLEMQKEDINKMRYENFKLSKKIK